MMLEDSYLELYYKIFAKTVIRIIHHYDIQIFFRSLVGGFFVVVVLHGTYRAHFLDTPPLCEFCVF